MVSVDGARKVQPLLDEIAALEKGVGNLTRAISGDATIWKMAADVYVQTASSSLQINYLLTKEETASILGAVKDVLQARLDARNTELKAIV